jgi:hypothetical protein
LATEISVFEHHFVAFAGVVDESLAQANQDTADPQPQK